MKYLRQIGLVSSLAIGGVLGGLMAPLPSEAVPSLTLQVDNGTPVNILGAQYTAGNCPSGYNLCYLANYSAAHAVGSNNRSFNVFIAPGTSAGGPKLLLNDTASQDAFKLTEVRFAPTSATSGWPNTESHVLKIVMSNTFSTANGAGSYVFALRSGGYLQAGGTVSPIYTQYDVVRFEGKGTFSPSLVNVPLLNVAPATTNLTPLQLQVANAVSATYFTLDQVVTYPTFACDADGAGSGTACTPTITLTMTVTVFGPDALVLTASNDALGGGPCKLTPADGVASPTGPVLPCHSNGKKKSSSDFIQQTFTANDSTDVTTAVTAGAVAAVQCTAADNCPCADPYDPRCAGTVVNVARVTPSVIVTFPFTATGPGIAPLLNNPPNFEITTNELTGSGAVTGVGRKTLSPLPVVGGGGEPTVGDFWTFTKGNFPLADPTHAYDIDTIACVSMLEPTGSLASKLDGFTTWVADSGSLKTGVRVLTMKGGDTVTCEWHIHKTSIN